MAISNSGIRQTTIYVINETILVHTKTLLSDSKNGGNLKEKGVWGGILDLCRTGIQSCVVNKGNHRVPRVWHSRNPLSGSLGQRSMSQINESCSVIGSRISCQRVNSNKMEDP